MLAFAWLAACHRVPAPTSPIERGAELFARVFTRADGLGPSYNATSCGDCHSLPAPGGAGSAERNVQLGEHGVVPRFGGDGGEVVGTLNAPSLFGLGAIADLDPAYVELAEIAAAPGADGLARRIGGAPARFGWKAQVGSLRDFVALACANELGLISAEHAGDPSEIELPAEDVDALTAYVASLPAPAAPAADHPGRAVFTRIGCAECHVPEVGGLPLFSDLLLHDLGRELRSGGRYGSATEDVDPALAMRWRTPPLWGVADTAPYLHDGRAPDLPAAIAAHGGAAAAARAAYTALPAGERDELLALLGAMEAP